MKLPFLLNYKIVFMYKVAIGLAFLFSVILSVNTPAQQGRDGSKSLTSGVGDFFPQESVWFNSIGPINLSGLNNKYTVLMVSDFNCLECGYFAKTIESVTDQILPIQFIQVFIPYGNAPYSRSRINNFIQQNNYVHPIGILPDFSGFRNSDIKHVPYFIIYDQSDIPTYSREGMEGFESVLSHIEILKKTLSSGSNTYSNYKIVAHIPPSQWANPVIEAPTYLALEEYGNGFYVNDVAHHRILNLSRNGECQSVAGSSILPGFDDGQEGNIQFQNARGMTSYGGKLYVADTYNNRLRQVEYDKFLATTVIGDGSFDSLALPTDVEMWKRKLYVADGFYNQIRQVDGNKRTSTVFANLPSQHNGLTRTYPINLSSGKKALYVVMSDGEIISIDKKGKMKNVPNKENISFSSVAEWKGSIVACSPSNNGIYILKKEQWHLLTNGADSNSVNSGVSPLNRPFDLAVVANELYVTDSDNHLIRVIHSEKENVPHIFSLELSDMLISDEASHTFGQPVEMDTIFVDEDGVAVKVKIDIQGYQILEGGKNLLVMHDATQKGDLLNEQISSDEFGFTINPIKEEDALYLECYLTLENPSKPGVPVIKRAYLFFHLEPATSAEPIQELKYHPDLLPN